MKIYMLRDVVTGLFYRRNRPINKQWVEQKKASRWTTQMGPVAAQTRLVLYTTEIEAFNLLEIV